MSGRYSGRGIYSCTFQGSECAVGSCPSSAADTRNHFSAVIARSKREAVFIERRGQRAAVVVSPQRYKRMLEALAYAENIAAFDEAMAEGAPVP